MKDSTFPNEIPSLLQALLELIVVAHRPAFRQERIFARVLALVFGELFNVSRQTIPKSLLALGLTDED